jgi:uncharacterized Fe-S center protein
MAPPHAARTKGVLTMETDRPDGASATVWFADLRGTTKQNILAKLERLLALAGLEDKVARKQLVAVKIHFGELGNTAYVRPVYVRRIVERVRATGARPFLVDTNTLYVGSRGESASHYETAIANGFDWSAVGAPVVIGGGLRGNRCVPVRVDLHHYREVEIAPEIADADAIIGVTHFKGHEMSGFGGTLKNFGMGAASRQGKLSMHSTAGPHVKDGACTACHSCLRWCAFGAMKVRAEDRTVRIDPELCKGCGACLPTCPAGAIQVDWNQELRGMQERMVEHASGAIAPKRGRAIFLNFLLSVSPLCDCYPFADAPLVPDVGILASTDPVAIDQASADLVNAQPGHPLSAHAAQLGPGTDKFRAAAPRVDWGVQLEYGERIGLGRRAYELVKV